MSGEQDAGSPTKERKPKKKRRIVIGVTVVLFLVLIFGIVGYLLGKPVQGTITIKKPLEDAAFDAESEQKRYKGEYFSFLVPGTYEEKAHRVMTDEPLRESIVLSFPNNSGERLAIVVEQRELGELSASPSFQMREGDQKIYQKRVFSRKDINGVVFSSHTMLFEEAAFFVKGNTVISMTLSSVISAEGLQDRLLKMIESIQWIQ